MQGNSPDENGLYALTDPAWGDFPSRFFRLKGDLRIERLGLEQAQFYPDDRLRLFYVRLCSSARVHPAAFAFFVVGFLLP